MRIHLYEFQSAERKVKCLCGWQKTLRKADLSSAYSLFSEHCVQAARPAV